MRVLIASILVSLFAFTSLSVAEDYTKISFGYTKHIAKDPHDSGGTTYLSDPEENGFVIGYAFGNNSDGISSEVETKYYSEVSQKLTSDVTVDVSTIASMFNIMATPGENEIYGIFGGGIGFGYSMVDTSYTSGSTTFNGDENTFNFGYQLILGLGADNYEVVFKHSNFGEVEGGSGTTSAGDAYNADEFDNVYNSIAFRIKY
mgnify:CR=1 FL=1